ncbi:pyruvate kinase [Lentzea fradiae]|uniref:Pyruvate kinase n=1 Tax=Lentzea fradiae TaxID=200378 RepID=A0A1G7XHJ8_9PSEU|nr:pyruvate kinase [Lentzea fradiae]SDG83699.1 pyruvate kinase [Lentzea fradiae]
MTHVVATVGPACSSEEALADLLKAGVGVFRFTASKTPVDRLSVLAGTVRDLADGLDLPVELVLDLPGAKPRLTNEEYLDLAGVTELVLRFDGGPSAVTGPVPELGVSGFGPSDALPDAGDLVVVGDGEDALRIVGRSGGTCTAVPLTRNVVGIRRGVSFPGAGRSGKAQELTEYDLAGLRAVAGTPFDAVVLSFAESAGLVERARVVLRESAGTGPLPAVVAKIETAAGAAAAAEIAEAADGILLGRGDLLLDTGPVEFHAACRQVLDAARTAGRPVLVGTQLLTSLAAGWLPHRSELATVSELLEQGVAGLMLAEETAGAADPVRAVTLLNELRTRYAPTAVRTALFPRRP